MHTNEFVADIHLSQVLGLWYLLYFVALHLSLLEMGAKHSSGMKTQFFGFLHLDVFCFTLSQVIVNVKGMLMHHHSARHTLLIVFCLSNNFSQFSLPRPHL